MFALTSFLLSETLAVYAISSAVFLIGFPVIVEGVKSIIKLKLDETALMVIAAIAAIFLGEAFEGLMVVSLFRLGSHFEAMAVEKSKKKISSLTQIRPDTASVFDNEGNVKTVDATLISIGTTIQIKPGERVPLDCTVVSGTAYIDSSALTGESMLVHASNGSKILSGSINTDGLLICKTTKTFQNSTASRIIKMVSEAAAKKGETEKMISKFAKVYTPIVVAMAACLAFLPPLLGFGAFAMWAERSLVFLVASCPCALVISVPLTFFAGVGHGAKAGMLIKGTKYIEALAKADCVAFDKTGTLTYGKPTVKKVTPLAGYTEEEVIHYAAMAEQFSNHPAAKAILSLAEKPYKLENVDYTETPGMGVSLSHQDGKIHCGSYLLMEKYGVDLNNIPKSNIYIALNNAVIGYIELTDVMREDSKTAIEKLYKSGVKTVAMLTGDSNNVALEIANEVGVNTVFSQLLPEDKVSKLTELKKTHVSTLFVGDGINDAPVLAISDVGIAMGLGTDTAIEAADMVLMNEKLSTIASSITLAKRIMAKARFNIFFALSIKAVVLVLGALGYAPIWAAVFADVGVSILAILNAVAPISVKE